MIRTLGIIGGMGTEAGIATTQIICSSFRAQNLSYPKITLISDESIPDRSAFIAGKSNQNPAQKISQIGSQLLSQGAENIIIACFTAHSPMIFNEIDLNVRNRIFSLFATLDQNSNANKKIAVLATTGSQLSRVFEQNLPNSQIIYPTNCDQVTLMSAIYEIKKSGINPKIEQNINRIATNLSKKADILLIGCTELLLVSFLPKLNIVNPIELLAKQITCKKLCSLF